MNSATGLVSIISLLATAGLVAGRGQAAGLYFSGDHSTQSLTITAADDAASSNYWRMVILGGNNTAPGRIMEFYDLTGEGNSDPTFNCVHRYGLGQGLLDPIDNRGIRDGGRWALTPGTATDGASFYNYTLTRDLVSGGYTNAISMNWTIFAPTPSGTRIIVTNNWFFPEGWPSGNGQCRADGWVGLYAAEYGDNGSSNEYTMASYNGPSPDGVGTQWIDFIVNAGVPYLAEGRAYRVTHIAPRWDDAYDTAWTDYADSDDYFGMPGARGYYALGLTGNWAGNPGTVPPGGTNFFSTIILGINIKRPFPKGSTMVVR